MSSERDYHSHFIFQKIEVMITQWEKIILGAGKDLETIKKIVSESGLFAEVGGGIRSMEVIDKYLNSLYNRKNLAHNTKVGYNVTVNTLKEYKLGYMEIGKIRPEHCEEWLSDMKKKYRGSSIQIQISLIKRSFEYAVDYDYIAKNPFRRITTDKSDSKKMEALSVNDMNRFLDFCSKDSHSSHCYDMLYVLFWTGLRASELCGLTLDNIDMNSPILLGVL